jgi:linoleoyl-CoA desaturase
MFPLYGISIIFWMYANDFMKYFNKAVNDQPMPKMSLSEHVIFWSAKIVYTALYVVAPLYFLGIGYGFLCYMMMQISMGIVLSLVFQLAHAVEDLHFEDATQYNIPTERLPNEWAVHQVMTTNNFATKSPFATWFMGGLNFQTEHHLFPNISHVHYPALNEILVPLCVKYNVKYNEMPTFTYAVGSHIRYMKSLGVAA